MKPLTVLLVLSLALAAAALKPSEAGVNDWHFSNLGEVREARFTKNKLQITAALGAAAVLDKYTGKIEARVVAAEAEKVVGWGAGQVSLATRYNQIVTYSVGQTGIDKLVNDKFMGENSKIDSIASVGKSEYFLSSSALFSGRQLLRESTPEEKFLKVAAGVRSDGKEILFLAYQLGSALCVESYEYEQDSFINKYCREQFDGVVSELEVVGGHLIVALTADTLFLTENLKLQTEINQKFIEIVGNTAVLTTRNYDFVTKTTSQRRPIKSSRSEVRIELQEDESHIRIFRDDIELFSIARSNKAKVLRAWFNWKSEMDYELLVQFTDLELTCFSASRGVAQEIWKREESLAYIEDVVFLKYNEVDTLDNEYHRNLISHSYRGLNLAQKLSMIPRDIAQRLGEEISDLQRTFVNLVSYAIEFTSSFDRNNIQKFQMSREQEVRLGLRKYLIAVTKSHTLIAIDTKTKQVLWKVNHAEIANNQFVGFVQLKRDYQTEIAVLVTYSPSTASLIIEEITEHGSINPLATLPASEKPTIFKLNDHGLTIKIGDRMEKFGLFQQDDLVEKQYYFYTSEAKQINGWKVIGQSVVKIWNFQTKGEERILKIASAFRGDQRAHIPLFDREKVFFKNVDFTNIAVVTSLNHTNIALYIINGRTGKVQFNSYKNNVNTGLPLNLIYDENNVLTSYFNARNKVFEIWTVEQYHERIETQAINMISDYLREIEYKPQENKENTIFETEVYASPVTIKEMYVSESKMSLTRRNIFVITREDKLYTINRDFVSTRRPKKQSKSFFSNEKFPEYNYLLPFNPSFYLSYDLPLQRLSHIHFSPTDMESSIFVFCFGLDNFLIRTAPDKTFDMITEDFNHVILLLILVAATIAIVSFKRILNLAKLKRPYIE